MLIHENLAFSFRQKTTLNIVSIRRLADNPNFIIYSYIRGI